MNELFLKALGFIREHPSIIYSLILIVLIPTALFFNTYTITQSFEKNIDRITHANAVLAENILKLLVLPKLGEPEELQALVREIALSNDKVVELTLLERSTESDGFRVIASTQEDQIGEEQSDIQNLLAWSQPEGIAFLAQNERGRFWRVTKSLMNSSGEKIGLVSLSLSIADSDAVIQSVINRAYFILFGIILVVVLFVSNQTRLFGYAVALSKLREVDKMKDTFISMASHELRSPLTAISGYLDLLKAKETSEKTDEESRHYLSNITASVHRLQTLVSDILDVSKLEGNRIPIELSSFDPTGLLSQSIEEMRSQAVLKHLELKWEEGPQSFILADEERLKQVVVNLLSNAIKYTDKGSVTMSSKVKDTEYLITVADTGYGISAEDQARLFQKFSRIQTEKTKSITGTGLGLWITMELTRRMGGSIQVESIEGVGSHFTIHLPLAQDRLEAVKK